MAEVWLAPLQKLLEICPNPKLKVIQQFFETNQQLKQQALKLNILAQYNPKKQPETDMLGMMAGKLEMSIFHN